MRSASRLSFVLGAVLLLAMAPRPAVAGLGGADLSVTLVDTPDPVTAGTNLTYTITVTNNGPDTALSASWSDTLPAGTTFASLSSPSGWSCTTPAPASGGTVSCSNPSFAVGSAAFTLRVAVTLAATGTISNTATVSAVITDPTPGNNSATATTTVGPVSNHLSITMAESADPVAAGTYLRYTITVTNSGPGPVDNVSWSDTLPAGTSFITLVRPGDWACSPSSPEPLTSELGADVTVSCSIATLGVGRASFTLVVLVSPFLAAGTILSNTVNVTTTTADDPADNSAAETTTVTVVSLTMTDTPDPVLLGGNITYTITATNATSESLLAALTEFMPQETRFVSIAAPDGWTCSPPPVGSRASFDCRNTFWPPGSAVFTLVLQVVPPLPPSDMTVSNSAEFRVNPYLNVFADASTQVLSAFRATKAVSAGPYTPGSTITYTVELSNSGPGAQADNPDNEFTDVLPAGLTLVNATATSGTAVATGANTVAWNGSIPAAGSVTITITATLNPGNVAGTTISNQGRFSHDADGNGTNESWMWTDDPAADTSGSDPTSFVVGAPATVSIVTSDFPDPAIAGTSLTYSISATNPGGANIGSATLTDPLPAGTTFDSLGPVPAGWSCATPAVGANGTVTCSASSFAPGIANFTINVTVDRSLPASTVLTNRAALRFTNGATFITRAYTTTTTVIRRAVIRAIKTASGNFTPGGSVTYTVVLSNTGSIDTGDNATDEFTDVLSPSLSNITATATSGTTAVDPATYTVTWNGGIPAGASVTLTITASIDAGLPPGTTISSQGRAFYDSDGDGNNDSNVQTDDPATPDFDATTFEVVEGEPPVPTNIPTLDEIGLALLVLLLGMGGALTLRKRRA